MSPDLSSPLSTTPTGHPANNMPIMPSKSNATLANSLYKCSNTGQLTNYYYACLNYPIKSTLTKAIGRGYLKDWWGLTSQQTHQHISVSTESKMGHMDQQCQGVQSTQPLQQPCHFRLPTALMTLWRTSLRNPTMPALTLSSWPSMKSIATSSPITQAASPLHQTAAMHMLWYSTTLMPIQYDLFPSRIDQKMNCFVPTVRSTSGSHTAVSNLSYTNLTMKHSKMLKPLLPRSKLASSTLPQTSNAQTPPNMPYGHGRITFLPAWQDYQIHSPLPTGVTSQRNAMPHSTCYIHVIRILSSWHTKRSRVLSLLTQHPWLP